MNQSIEVKVPGIGDFKDVPIIELCVKPGDTVQAEDALLTLESDKATIDIPSPAAGVLKEFRVAVGDKVSEGLLVAIIEAVASAAEEARSDEPPSASPAPVPAPAAAAPPSPVAPVAPLGPAKPPVRLVLPS